MFFEQRFCPNCGSNKVEPDNRRTNILGEMIFNPDKRYCRKCEYTGLMPSKEQNDQENGDIEFEPNENEKIDTDAGRAYAKYYVLLIILSLIYAGILLLK